MANETFITGMFGVCASHSLLSIEGDAVCTSENVKTL